MTVQSDREPMCMLVVGAGLAGATVARVLADAGINVEVVDKRDHIAGNAFDSTHETGIRVHKYGPHIFHTSSESVWKFVNRFSRWVPYEHKVRAMMKNGQTPIIPLQKSFASQFSGDEIINTFFRPYSEKMWGISLEEIDDSILKRVPTRQDDGEGYFPKDKYQALPDRGYTELVKSMLAHPLIKVRLNHCYQRGDEDAYTHTFNSMPIDEYYAFEHGQLPYRSIKFHHHILPGNRLLPVPTLNFTDHGPYTRVTEWSNYPGHRGTENVTLLTFEEPCDYTENNFERYYPVKDKSGTNRARYERYRSISNENVTFIGRCGLYTYLDMDQAISSSLSTANNFLKKIAHNRDEEI